MDTDSTWYCSRRPVSASPCSQIISLVGTGGSSPDPRDRTHRCQSGRRCQKAKLRRDRPSVRRRMASRSLLETNRQGNRGLPEFRAPLRQSRRKQRESERRRWTLIVKGVFIELEAIASRYRSGRLRDHLLFPPSNCKMPERYSHRCRIGTHVAPLAADINKHAPVAVIEVGRGPAIRKLTVSWWRRTLKVRTRWRRFTRRWYVSTQENAPREKGSGGAGKGRMIADESDFGGTGGNWSQSVGRGVEESRRQYDGSTLCARGQTLKSTGMGGEFTGVVQRIALQRGIRNGLRHGESPVDERSGNTRKSVQAG